MDLDQILHPGMQAKADYVVREQDAASHVGSGSLRLLATPSMVAFIEQTARLFLDGLLPDGQTSVGVRVDIRHLAATPVGGKLHILCSVAKIEGVRVNFTVQVQDDVELVGEGTHQRAVIAVDRFMRRVYEKANRLDLV